MSGGRAEDAGDLDDDGPVDGCMWGLGGKIRLSAILLS